MTQAAIYTLTDPTTNLVYYVGQTFNPLKERLYVHVSSNYLPTNKKLKIIGIRPIIEAIEYVDYTKAKTIESYWICQFKAWGFKLENMRCDKNYSVFAFNHYILPKYQTVRISGLPI